MICDIRKYVLLFSTDFCFIIDTSQQYCEHFRNFEQVEFVGNLHLNYLSCRFFALYADIFATDKMENFDFDF